MNLKCYKCGANTDYATVLNGRMVPVCKKTCTTKLNEDEILKLARNVLPDVENFTVVGEQDFVENKHKDLPFNPILIYVVPIHDKPIKVYFVGNPCPYNKHIKDCDNTERQDIKEYPVKCLNPDCYIRQMELEDN